jgi:hypothetical protein
MGLVRCSKGFKAVLLAYCRNLGGGESATGVEVMGILLGLCESTGAKVGVIRLGGSGGGVGGLNI